MKAEALLIVDLKYIHSLIVLYAICEQLRNVNSKKIHSKLCVKLSKC